MRPEAIQKYCPFPQVSLPDRTWPDRVIDRAPIWCSVDLRDGNQALPQPMSVEEKLEMFDLLVMVGFKQIEVGFPSAADTEFNFLRRLVEQNRIPDDVQIQVLVQAREHLIKRTFESLVGVRRAIVHVYNSTSPLQRRVTFGNASRESIREIAIAGVSTIKQMRPSLPETEITLQYSPESFSDTELDFSLEICEAVMDVWEPTPDEKLILNLPATVEWTTPNVHADQIEWFCRHLKRRDCAWISLHTHNDRGTGTAATELGLLAGADRVEGTLFGNGERTGNLDITTLALNMNSHGIYTGLHFANLPEIRDVYERTTRMSIHERHPYVGELVFTAFSGSHQDAIKKGFDMRAAESSSGAVVKWGIPYLTIDPQDIGRTYESIVRINSQSGKGGIAYVLDREHGFDLPKTMHPQVGRRIYSHADELGRELSPEEIREFFFAEFVNVNFPLSLVKYELEHKNIGDEVVCHAEIAFQHEQKQLKGSGNGPINAFVHALQTVGLKNFVLTDYRSHAVRGGSDSDSAAYIQLQAADENGDAIPGGTILWGCGVHSSIEMAGLKALVCASNLLR